jgi:hypothetical protein
MGILRLASVETTRIELGDDEYLVVRTDLSKKDYNRILKRIPADYDPDKGFTIGQADDFTIAVFDALVTGWSLPDEPSVDNYLLLAREAANVVDEKLITHFNSLTPSAEERSKSQGNRK